MCLGTSLKKEPPVLQLILPNKEDNNELTIYYDLLKKR